MRSALPLLLAIIGCCIARPALAQPTGGIKIGANAAHQRSPGQEDPDINLAPGLLAGAFLSFPLSERLAVQPEVQYSQLGTKYAFQQTRVHLDEVTVPLLVKLFLAKRLLNVHVGPQIGFVTRAKYETDDGTTKTTTDVRSQYHAADYGAVVGIGVNLPLRLTLDIRYVYGVADISKPVNITIRGIQIINDYDLQQHTIQLLLGLRIF